MAFLLCFLSLFFEPHPTLWCFLLSVIGLLSLPSWMVICLAFVFQVFVWLSSSLVFLFSAGCRSVGRIGQCRLSQRQVVKHLRNPACPRWSTPAPRPEWRSRWWSWSSSAGGQERDTWTGQDYILDNNSITLIVQVSERLQAIIRSDNTTDMTFFIFNFDIFYWSTWGNYCWIAAHDGIMGLMCLVQGTTILMVHGWHTVYNLI